MKLIENAIDQQDNSHQLFILNHEQQNSIHDFINEENMFNLKLVFEAQNYKYLLFLLEYQIQLMLFECMIDEGQGFEP